MGSFLWLIEKTFRPLAMILSELWHLKGSLVQVSPNVVGLLSTIRRWQDVVSSITCPTLLITADPNLGAIVTPEIAQTILEVNEDIELIHLAGAGHNIRREQFEPFVEVVTEFLKRKR